MCFIQSMVSANSHIREMKLLLLFQKLTPCMEGKESLKKEANHSRLVCGRFNKHGKLHMRFVLGGCETNRLLNLPTRILKVYLEAFTGFSHMYFPDGLHHTLLSQGCVLENSSSCGKGGQKVHGKGRGGVEEL